MAKKVSELSDEELIKFEEQKWTMRMWAHGVGIFQGTMFWYSGEIISRIIIFALMSYIAYTIKDLPRELKLLKNERKRRGI